MFREVTRLINSISIFMIRFLRLNNINVKYFMERYVLLSFRNVNHPFCGLIFDTCKQTSVTRICKVHGRNYLIR